MLKKSDAVPVPDVIEVRGREFQFKVMMVSASRKE